MGVEETLVATTGGAVIAHFASSLDEGKTAKSERNVSQGERNVSHLRHKPLKSLLVLNQ
jgi:hypothetical protein